MRKHLTQKQIKLYCELEYIGKSKRLRKKAKKILEEYSKGYGYVI